MNPQNNKNTRIEPIRNFLNYYYLAQRATLAFMLIFYVLAAFWVYANAAHGEALYEVAYMSAIYWAVALLWLILKGHRTYQRLGPLFEALETQAELASFHLPKDHSAEGSLLRAMAQNADRQHQVLVSRLLDTIRENEDYASLLVHEMKSPLAVLKMQMSVLSDSDLASSMEEELGRLERLTEQFLYFSRSNDFSNDYLIAEQSLKKLMLEALKKHRKALQAKQLELLFDAPAGQIVTDARWFVYLLEQGLSNAIKYSPEGAKLHFYAHFDKEKTRLRIENQGPNIPSEDLPRLYDRGFTGSANRYQQQATGMGLYLANRMAQRLGHGLDVSNIEGVGVRFEVVVWPHSELAYKSVRLNRNFDR